MGVDIAKQDHWAYAMSAEGEEIFSRAVPNDEVAMEAMIDAARASGRAVLVVDTTSSSAMLLLAVAARRQVPVVCVPGAAMRHAARSYEGAAKTDPLDAHIARAPLPRLPGRRIVVDLLTGP